MVFADVSRHDAPLPMTPRLTPLLLTALVAACAAPPVAINSLGIREWMHFVAGLNSGGARLVHEKCSEVLVEQMCFIPAVRGGGAVRSFHAPYYCPRCDLESRALIDVEIHGEALRAMEAPGFPCPQCKGPMTLADVPERIFAFLVEH